MLKLALCFSGDARTYDKCFSSIKHNLLDKFDCDVFISTYHTSDKIHDDILNLYSPKKYNFNDKDEVIKICSTYSKDLGRVKINPIDMFKTPQSNNTTIINTIEGCFFNYDEYSSTFQYSELYVVALCQFFGIHDVSKLCKEYMLCHNINYDYILRIRLDNKFCSDFIVDELQDNELLINCIQNYSNSIKLHDHFFMAKPTTFFKISFLYANLPNVINAINNNKCWLPCSGYQETLLLIHTLLNDVTVKEAKFFCDKLN